MGHLSPDKAKQKFTKLKNNLVLVKTNWAASGNGDGAVLREREIEYGSDGEELDEEESEILTCNGCDMKNFLKGFSPAVLYLWKKAAELFCQKERRGKAEVSKEKKERNNLRSWRRFYPKATNV